MSIDLKEKQIWHNALPFVFAACARLKYLTSKKRRETFYIIISKTSKKKHHKIRYRKSQEIQSSIGILRMAKTFNFTKDYCTTYVQHEENAISLKKLMTSGLNVIFLF